MDAGQELRPRVGLYCRISEDPRKERLGVQRQSVDLGKEADRRGWKVVATFEDDDLSGGGGVYRPGYDEMVGAITDGSLDAVLAWDVDRLHRGFAEFISFYEACDRAKIRVGWLGGEADFATGRGLFELELRASFAREELRKLKQRVRRKHQELLERGQYIGQRRTFGYRWDEAERAIVVVPEEAAAVREAAKRVLAGETLGSICRDWRRRGITGIEGGQMTESPLRRILVSGRISGRRDLHMKDGRRLATPEIRGAAENIPAIISPDMSDQVRAAIIGRGSGAVIKSVSRYLLTGGIARCGQCGRPLQPGNLPRRGKTLVCKKTPPYSGCGHISAMMQPVEEYVVDAIFASVSDGALERILHSDAEAKQISDELDGVRSQLRDLGRRFGQGEISSAEWEGLRPAMIARERALEQRLGAHRRQLAIADVPHHLEEAWPTLELHQRRAIVSALIDQVMIHPRGHSNGPRFDTSRIEIRWRA